MKKLLFILSLCFLSLLGESQPYLPQGVPSVKTPGWYRYGYIQNDSGYIPAKRDTLWSPLFTGTQVYWEHAGVDTATWEWGGVGFWWHKIGDGGSSGTVTLSGDVGGSGTTSIVTTIGAGKVTEAMQVLADNTTQNVSTSKHGYAPKGDGNTAQFLNANGAYSVPAGTAGYGAPTSLTYGATTTMNVALNTTLSKDFTVTLTGNTTLSMTNLTAGDRGVLTVIQDATGSRTMTVPVGSKIAFGYGASLVLYLSTAASTTDLVYWYYNGTIVLFTGIATDFQ